MDRFKSILIYGAISALGSFPTLNLSIGTVTLVGAYWLLRRRGNPKPPNEDEDAEDSGRKDPDLDFLLGLMDQIVEEYGPVVKYFRAMYRKLKTQPPFSYHYEAKRSLASRLTRQSKLFKWEIKIVQEVLAGVEGEVCRMKKIDQRRLIQLSDKFGRNKRVLAKKKEIEKLVDIRAKADIAFHLSKNMNPDIYLKIGRRLNADMRHQYFLEVKKADGKSAPSSPSKKVPEDTQESLRRAVCEFYGVQAREGETYKYLLMMASYAFMGDTEFEAAIEREKQFDNHIVLALSKGIPLVGIDVDPLKLTEDELEVSSR